jgi:hypothetical protein
MQSLASVIGGTADHGPKAGHRRPDVRQFP